MSEALEETNFDYIVLGTGLIESILAGSLARSGKKVLHLDSKQNYGGNWAVFGFRELVSWYLDQSKESVETPAEGDLSIDYDRQYKSNFRNVEVKLYAKETPLNEPEATENDNKTLEELIQKPTSKTDQALFDAFYPTPAKQHLSEMSLFTQMINKSRSYNFDTTPKLLGTREDLVEILIKSGVGRYLEFKNVDDIYIYDNASKFLEKVPSSKEDVFTNKTVTLIEKRKLMKYLTFAMEFNKEDPILDNTEKMTFTEFLQDKFKISGKLQDAIVYAIALVDKTVSVDVGLSQTHKFVSSMGRFGKGAYLCPLYGGASEIGQAFCRVCAVYGGVYILNQALDKYIIEDSECKGVVTKEGTEYRCDKLITGIDYLNKSWLPEQGEFGAWISRAMVLSNHSLNADELKQYVSDNLSYCIFPPGSDAGNTDTPIYGIYQNDETMACPKGEYITYLWTTSQDKSVLEKAVELLSKKRDEEDTESHIKMTVYYQQRSRTAQNLDQLPKNVIPCSDPDTTMDFESSTSEARRLFYQCEPPETEFMPAAEEQEQDEEF